MANESSFRYLLFGLAIFVTGYMVLFVGFLPQGNSGTNVADLEELLKKLRVEEQERFKQELEWASERYSAQEKLWKMKEKQWEDSLAVWRQAYERLLSTEQEHTKQAKVELELLKSTILNNADQAKETPGASDQLERLEKQMQKLEELEKMMDKIQNTVPSPSTPSTPSEPSASSTPSTVPGPAEASSKDPWVEDFSHIPESQRPHVRILYWNAVYGNKDWKFFDPCPEYPECKVGFEKCRRLAGSCTMTWDHAEADNVDAIVFHSRDGMGTFPTRNPKVPWILLGKESAAHDPLLRNEGELRRFNMSSTYRYDTSEMVWSYVDWPDIESVYRMPVPIEQKNKEVPIAWVASNCGTITNRRTDYVKELMKYVKIDSYGQCLGNKAVPPELQAIHRGESAIRLASQYRFYLAFENSNCNGYVSEKFWRAIVSGAVPIVLGAPDIDNYAPTNHSIIKASDFASAKDLAEYINKLHNDDNLYKEYLSYKFDRKLAPHFREFWYKSYAGCNSVGLCDYLAKLKLGLATHSPDHYPPPDNSCEDASKVRV